MRLAFFFAFLGTGFTCLMTALGAAVVFFLRPNSSTCLHRATLGFAGGVMLAASIWSLLLPSLEQTSKQLPVWLPATVGIAAGSAFLFALDALLRHLSERKGKSSLGSHRLLFMAAITLHNIPEGMAVGLACAVAASSGSPACAAALALGIGIQNFPEGAAISLPLFEDGKSKLVSFLGGFLSGLAEPIFGILVVFASAWLGALMPWLLSFAAGAMLYAILQELMPAAAGADGTVGFLLGFLVMMILDVSLG